MLLFDSAAAAVVAVAVARELVAIACPWAGWQEKCMREELHRHTMTE